MVLSSGFVPRAGAVVLFGFSSSGGGEVSTAVFSPCVLAFVDSILILAFLFDLNYFMLRKWKV